MKASTAAENVPHVAGSVDEALASVAGFIGTFLGFAFGFLAGASRQQTQAAISLRLFGMFSEVPSIQARVVVFLQLFAYNDHDDFPFDRAGIRRPSAVPFLRWPPPFSETTSEHKKKGPEVLPRPFNVQDSGVLFEPKPIALS